MKGVVMANKASESKRVKGQAVGVSLPPELFERLNEERWNKRAKSVSALIVQIVREHYEGSQDTLTD